MVDTTVNTGGIPNSKLDLLELIREDIRSHNTLSEVGEIGVAVELAHAVETIALGVPDGGDTAASPIRAVVIAGLPRSGTTYFLHVMSMMSPLRTLEGWEAQYPYCRRHGTVESAKAATAERFDAAPAIAPRLQELHSLSAAGPEESTPLLQNTLECIQWAIMFRLPNYVTWLIDRSRTSKAHLGWRDQLHAIDPGCNSWLLKSPLHGLDYAGLASVLDPESVVVEIRREPVELVTSFMNLV